MFDKSLYWWQKAANRRGEIARRPGKILNQAERDDTVITS
jgi:hypothetical protein